MPTPPSVLAVREIWRSLDPAVRREVDIAVAAGEAVWPSPLATVGLWRALRLRRSWIAALLVTPALAVGAGVAAALGLGTPAAEVLLTLRSPALYVVVVAASVGPPAWRLRRLHQAIGLNSRLALTTPQMTTPVRPKSELARHLALRAARRRVDPNDGEA